MDSTWLRLSMVFVVLLLLLMIPVGSSQSTSVAIGYGRSWPRYIIVDGARGLAYVDGQSGIYPPTGFSFGIINASSHTLLKVLPLDEIPREMALDPAGGDVYVAGDTSIAIFNAAIQNFSGVLNIGIPVQGMAFDPGTGRMFVSSGNSVYAFNPINGSKVGSSTVGEGASGIALDPADGLLYVANNLSCSVSVLRTSSLDTVTTVHLPSPCFPSEVVLDQRAGALYVAAGTASIDVLGTANDVFERSIQVAPNDSNETMGIALDQRSGDVFVLTQPGTTVSQVDPSDGSVVARFQLSSGADQIAVDQSTGQVYVTVYHEVDVFSPGYGGASPALAPSLVAPVILAAGLLGICVIILLGRRRMKAPMRDD